MESYKKHLEGNSKVVMIHFSYDESDAEALEWAQKEKFPWLTVLEGNHDAADLEKFAGDSVPEYLLLSSDGKLLASGKDECFKQIAAMKNEVASAQR